MIVELARENQKGADKSSSGKANIPKNNRKEFKET